MIKNERERHSAREPRVGQERNLFARSRRSLLRALVVFCVTLIQAFNPGAAISQDSTGEYELKAAMLYNLTRFVEWPPSAYADAKAPTVLCILGRDPFGDSLASLASKQTVSGRAVEVRHIPNEKGMGGCQVVYISSSERKNLLQILSSLKGASILTVGEISQFAARGGMIQFSLEEKQVRFEINLDAASKADLKISSRLLVLARVVKEQSKNPGREGSAILSRSLEVASTRPLKWVGELEPGFAETAVSSQPGDELRRSP